MVRWTEFLNAGPIGVLVLSGSLFQLPVRILPDKCGVRRILGGVMILSAIPMYFLSTTDSYGSFILMALGFGLAGTSFAIGVAYTSVWFRRAHQGTALRIFGTGGACAAIRPWGKWLADKWSGARLTHWDTIIMIGSAMACGWIVGKASVSPSPERFSWTFRVLVFLLFATAGIGNGSTLRTIAVIIKPEHARPVLGRTSGIAAYGAFLISVTFALQINAGRLEYAMYGFAIYYLTFLVISWWCCAQKNAEVAC
ncbi:MAG: hypothetical protein IT365_29315 [Candidatus Hydrogenedentes bacterium]|nr:hypothetical protein [Candidatus Hydrogenedentota bacterium]